MSERSHLVQPAETMPCEETWQRLDDRLLNQTRVFDVRAKRMRSPNGNYEDDFYYITSPDWVNIIPITPKKEIVLVRQYRHGISGSSLETPGGLVDAGESDPLYTAVRELSEETGYVSKNVISLGFVNPNPAMLNNRCHIYAAFDARLEAVQNLEPSEDITVHLEPLANIPKLLQNGTITHAIVASAFFLLWSKHPELF